jgi:hypothetical protein
MNAVLNYIVGHSLIAAVFAIIYAYIHRRVLRTLVRRALKPSSTPQERKELQTAMGSRTVAGMVREEQAKNNTSTETQRDDIKHVLMDPDADVTLGSYKDQSLSFWFMSSLLIQAGIGGEFDQVVQAQRLVVITQVMTVLALTAYAITTRTR